MAEDIQQIGSDGKKAAEGQDAAGKRDTRPAVGVILGSASDAEVMEACTGQLDAFGIPYELKIASAHRQPEEVRAWAQDAETEGIQVIIAAAGKAAHLAGVVAAYTPLPVIGVPIKTSDLGGIDSLLSTVQMPSGVPVACVAINGARNAAILATQILGASASTEKPIAQKARKAVCTMKYGMSMPA